MENGILLYVAVGLTVIFCCAICGVIGWCRHIKRKSKLRKKSTMHDQKDYDAVPVDNNNPYDVVESKMESNFDETQQGIIDRRVSDESVPMV